MKKQRRYLGDGLQAAPEMEGVMSEEQIQRGMAIVEKLQVGDKVWLRARGMYRDLCGHDAPPFESLAKTDRFWWYDKAGAVLRSEGA